MILPGTSSVLSDQDSSNIWARWGYIPPHKSASFAIEFDEDQDSDILFFVNGAGSVDGSLSAGYITAAERIIDTALGASGGTVKFQDATLGVLMEATEISVGPAGLR